jgi:hypothetical protein
MSLEKIKVVKEWPTLTTVKEVQAYPYDRLVECPPGLFLHDARDR